jgi:hypothetical protein
MNLRIMSESLNCDFKMIKMISAATQSFLSFGRAREVHKNQQNRPEITVRTLNGELPKIRKRVGENYLILKFMINLFTKTAATNICGAMEQRPLQKRESAKIHKSNINLVKF